MATSPSNNKCLAILSPYQPGDISPWKRQMEAEQWVVSVVTLAATDTVATVHALIIAANPAHVQLFGPVPVPQVSRNPDGHGYRPGDCDAPYATNDLKQWLPQPDGSFAQSTWPVAAARTVSRLDTTALPVDAESAFNAAIDSFCKYSRGEWEPEGGIFSNYLTGLDPTLSARLTSSLEQVAGAGNVRDVSGAYPEDLFCQIYAGSYLEGALYGGGDPFRQADGFQGHIYYTCRTADLAASLTQFALLRVYCSYGWEFERWPFMRGANAGGTLAVLYDKLCTADLSAWSETTSVGEALRSTMHRQGYEALDTIQGFATIRRMPVMGVSQAQFDTLQLEVDGLKDRLDAMTTNAPPALAKISYGPATIPGWQHNDGIIVGMQWPTIPVPQSIDMSGANLGPQLLYRQYLTNPSAGGMLYIMASVSPGKKLRCHFCETFYPLPGMRKMDILADGVKMVAGFDIFTAAGGINKALTLDLAVQPGLVELKLLSINGSYPLLCGVEEVDQ